MGKPRKTVVRDEALGLEAYRFQGMVQPFPHHFHNDYVLGYVEAGARTLSCRGMTLAVGPGDLLLFQPGEGHSCVQADGTALDYRGFILPPALVEAWAAANYVSGLPLSGELWQMLRKVSRSR